MQLLLLVAVVIISTLLKNHCITLHIIINLHLFDFKMFIYLFN